MAAIHEDQSEQAEKADEEQEDIPADAPVEPPPPQSTSGVHFPIEGESKWVLTMRLLAAGTIGAVISIGLVFHFFGGDKSSFVESQQLAFILGGIVLLLVFEYFVFLKIVIPRQADYGRYRIHKEMVEYFPLTSFGLGIKEKPDSVAVKKFTGVAVSTAPNKKNKLEYGVYLIHQKKGRTITVKTFPVMQEAQEYAHNLAASLRLNVGNIPRSKRTTSVKS